MYVRVDEVAIGSPLDTHDYTGIKLNISSKVACAVEII